jgi:hypothetical protein
MRVGKSIKLSKTAITQKRGFQASDRRNGINTPATLLF